MAVVTLPGAEIVDAESFHSVCQRIFGFPAFYGRNMDAWIDCMSYLDDLQAGMTSVVLKPDELLLVQIPDADAFRKRLPEVFAELIDCSAIVNRRFVARGKRPPLGLLLA